MTGDKLKGLKAPEETVEAGDAVKIRIKTKLAPSKVVELQEATQD